jgi:predicted Zn-dependent peptidase
VHTQVYEGLFPDHPLGWEIVGTEETIHAMTPDAIRAFHDEWYHPANFVVAAAGPVGHDALVAAVAESINEVTGGARPERVAPVLPAELRRVVRRPGETSHIALGWRALSHDDPDRFALAVANQLIGVGLSSRLFQEVREERGLAYSVFSSLSSYEDTGVFSVYAGTMPKRVSEVLEVVDRQLADVAANGPAEHELAVAKGALTGATLINLEDTGSRMARLATSMVVRDRVLPIDEFLRAIDAVTVDDVRRIAAKVFGVTPTIAIVGPRRSTGLVGA